MRYTELTPRRGYHPRQTQATSCLKVGAKLAGEILRDLGGVARLALGDGPDALRRLLHRHSAAEEPDIELLALAELLAALALFRGVKAASGDNGLVIPTARLASR